jgi:sugar lactone lactonase YvrE
MNQVERFLPVQTEMGETPIWVPEEKALYFVDAAKHIIYRLDPNTKTYQSFQPDMPVRALCRRASRGWLLVTDNGLAFWDQQTNKSEFIVNPYPNNPDLQFNDGMIDRQGRLIVGSFNHTKLEAPDGSLYRLDSDCSLHKLDSQLVLSNGIGISPDSKTLYIAEMFAHKITAYDYDARTGTVSNRRMFVYIPPENGMPDGVTVDSEGFVWTAHWDGWRVTRYAPNGKLERTIMTPVKIATCIGFGGENMDELYITSAWYSLSEQERKEQPWAGDLFRIKTDVKGLVEPVFLG